LVLVAEFDLLPLMALLAALQTQIALTVLEALPA